MAYPHFGLSLGLRFHSQGLANFSRQLHVVAVVVKDRDYLGSRLSCQH